MNKIFLIVKREYLTRVRKKSFIVMTFFAPLLLIGFYSIVIYLTINKDIGSSTKQIYVSDESGLFTDKLHSNELYQFTYGTLKTGEEKKLLEDEQYFGVLLIPKVTQDDLNGIKLIYSEQPGIGTVSYIEDQLKQEIKSKKLSDNHIDPEVIRQINSTKVNIATEKLTSSGYESASSEASTVIGFVCAFLIYIFIFLYGVQIMQGVIEEKTNRIVEVLISSVKPFQLMMGKIIGIALVGLTQFVMWMLLMVVLGGSISGTIMAKMNVSAETMQAAQTGPQQSEMGSMIGAMQGFNYAFILGMFLFYFIGGYLFYGSLFAAVGSAIDNDTDKQQFMLPITIPMVFAIMLAQSVVISNPNGTLAFWLSIIPFTSPIIMMVRIPFGVPLWEVILSMICMIGGFIFTVWLAARIYRVGILMYGKKASYKELGKWLFYKG